MSCRQILARLIRSFVIALIAAGVVIGVHYMGWFDQLRLVTTNTLWIGAPFLVIA